MPKTRRSRSEGARHRYLIGTFEHQNERLRGEKAELHRQLDSEDPEAIDLQATLAFAEAMLSDIPGCWNRIEWQDRPGLLRVLFPDGLTFEEDSIGTSDKPWWIRPIEEATAESDALVPPTGFEPVLPA